MSLVERLIEELGDGPASARDLARRLDQDKSVINSALYQNRSVFRKSGSIGPVWSLKPGGARPRRTNGTVAESPHPSKNATAPKLTPFDPDTLYSWQRDAMAAWVANGRRGIVEAVTGAGKTRLGLAATSEALAARHKVAVVVPSRELVRQWREQLRATFPGTLVGQLGDGEQNDLGRCDVVVATVQSGSKYSLGLNGNPGLLIADECHRYAAETFRLALEDEFDRRLGLSATYRRSDGAHETVLEPYFNGVVYELGYRQAIDEGVVCRFRVALIPVGFSVAERQEYDEFSERMSKARSRLVNQFGVPREPFDRFFAEVTRLSKGGTMREGMAARSYLSAFSGRRELLAETPAKLQLLTSLAPAVTDSDRALLFTQTTEAADRAAAHLASCGVRALSLHSGLPDQERKDGLASFATGSIKALVAPKILDEGVDVPAADLAVILAASRQRRQMVQRMGRVLRRKEDQRQARFAITFVAGTSEDPATGAHEAFLDEILDVAEEVCTFAASASPEDIREYLRPSLGPTPGADGTVRGRSGDSRRGAGLVGDPLPRPSSKERRHARAVAIADSLGLSVAQLAEIRAARAVAVLGTKGMTKADRRRRVARAAGVPVDLIERLEYEEARFQ